MKNGLAPINRIPPEVLALIPDSWDRHYRDEDIIALTHVCRVWREIFVSRSSLWTELEYVNAAKTRVYLERSKLSPIDLWVQRVEGLAPDDPFLEIDPHTIRRLGSLFIHATSENLQDITTRLPHHAPLLESLIILTEGEFEPQLNPVVTTELFCGDPSSLRELHLSSIRTELPWRNMVALTSFNLTNTPPGDISIKQLLDFLEGAPYLREIHLHSVPLAFGDQGGRLVSLVSLKSLTINGEQPTSPLLDHLLVPVGADLHTVLVSPGPRIEDHLPSSLDNLRNLSGFTRLRLRLSERYSTVCFTGPNGEVNMASISSGVDTAGLVLGFLAQFDTSTANQLKIIHSHPLSEVLLCRALLPMKNLSALTISRSKTFHSFIRALNPNRNSSNTLICPKLEELVLRIGRRDVFDLESVVGMTAARASRGAELNSVRVVNLGKPVPVDVSEPGKPVSHVEYCHKDSGDVGDDSDSDEYGEYSDEEG